MHTSLSRLFMYGMAGFVVVVFSASAQIKIYWTATDGSGAYIVRANADGSNPVNIVSGIANVKGPNGLETANGLLYWPDQQLNAIQQANPDGSGVATFATASNPYDVFGTATQIYWTSQTGNYIDTQLTNGTGFQRIFTFATVTSPFAVEVTASNIYWSEVSGQGRIRRSDLNGNNIVTLIPNVFVYDFQVTSNYIYFADINYPSGALKRANLDGTGITNLVSGAFGGVDLINGICVTTNFIYWSEYNPASGGGIRRASLGGTGRVDLYNAPPGSGIRGVVVLPEVAAPAAPPIFTSSALSPGGFAYTLQVESGRTYRIETSGNLTNWTEITNFLSAGTTVTLTNVIPVGATNLFFRARTP
ncbi:MAG: DUF5050 domain-containing protein [Verrucomicrobia bacterium]|nr:DUF5050 domain-containing protein [Verrucomicrobiota bacterium]